MLLIMADQLPASWLPVYGHEVVQAPNLSAFAEGATVFESAYCASPLCAPSRASLLTGLLPSRTEVFDNAAEMRASMATITHRLRAAGYFTAVAGKMHFIGPDQLHGFEERLTTDIYPADLDWTPDWRLPLRHHLPWYHTMESVLRPGQCVASMQQDYDDEVAFRATRKLFDLAREQGGRPFFLTVSFTNPHDPWEIRPCYWDLYDPATIDLPEVGPIPQQAADAHSRRLREMYGADEVALVPETVRRARHGYYAAISYLDDRIGDVLGALRATGLEDDTAVVLCTDHGEMLGERGLWYKMSFFEHSARVPLLLRLPGARCPRRVSEPVSLLDLAPTLLDIVGLSPDGLAGDLDGVSLTGLLASHGASRAEPVLGEYLAEGVTAPAVMIRRGRHKFVACEGDSDQLYDLAQDPAELRNLANPEHRALVEQFREEVGRRWNLADLRERVLASQRERRLVVSALAEGTYTSWDFAPSVDASTRYVRSRADLYALQRRARLEVPDRIRSTT